MNECLVSRSLRFWLSTLKQNQYVSELEQGEHLI